MATKTGYSAGTVFLQVVPSYQHFMNRLRKDLNGPLQKAMEAEADRMMEKAGIKGGEKYADGVQKAVNERAKRGAFASDAIKALDKAMADAGKNSAFHDRMKQLQDDFKAGRRDANELADELYELRDSLRKVGREDSNIDIRTNADTAARSLDRAADAGRSFARQSETAERAQKALGNSTRRTTRDIDDNDKSMSGLRGKLFGLATGTNDAANSFRFFNFAVLAAATVGPALIPILAGIGGGLAALGVSALAVAGAMGVAAIALSGISAAVQAMGQAQKSGARDARSYAHAQIMAARQVADARRAVDAARRSASESIRRALEQERQAEMRLADAQRDAKRAQTDLTKARQEAKRELMDLADQVAQNQLDERQGVIDLFNAYNTYGATMADGGSTNLQKEQADINLKQAELNLKRIRDEQARLTAEKSEADKTGVDGTETVIRAQERVTEAIAREKEARLDLKEASRDVDRARADGARQVADAQRQLNRALEDQKYAATQTSAAVDNLNESMKNLSPAAQRFARFIFGLRQGFYELRAIAAENMLPGLQSALERLINHYGPGFKGFVRDMSKSLGDLSGKWADSFTSRPWTQFFGEFRNASIRMNEDLAYGFMGIGEGLANVFRLAIPLAEQFTGWVKRIGERFSEWSSSKEGQEAIKGFFDYVSRIAPKVGAFFESLVGFFVAMGKALAPIGETIMGALTDFFNWVSNMDPGVLRLIAGGILAIVAAMQISTGLVAFVSIVSIIGGSWALGALVAVTALGAAFVFLGGSGGKAGGALDKLGKAMKPIIGIFKELGSYIGGKFKSLWEETLQPGFEDLAHIITTKFLPAFERFWPVVRPIVHFLIDVVFGAISGAISGIIDIIGGTLRVLSGLMDFITGVFTGNWSLAWKGIKSIFHGIFQAMWGIVKTVFNLGIFGLIRRLFTKALPAVFRSAGKVFKTLITKPFDAISKFFMGFISGALKRFRSFRDEIGKLFSKIGSFVGKKMGNPILDVANFVINKALIGGVNKLLGWLNIKPVGTVHIRKHFATGGVVDGYAPGVDKVHAMLSPGEGILRPEVVKAMGRGFVDGVNRAAIRGGVGAVQNALGMRRYAKGGVVWPSKTRRLSANYRGHTGIDIAAPYGSGVYAATAGRITSAPRWNYSYGNHIRLAGGGVTQIYAHLSRILARVGQMVGKGQQIGKVGSTGNSTGPHLHFEVRPGGTYGSALAFLRGAGKPSGKTVPSIWDKISGAGIKALANPVGYLKDLVSGAWGKVGGLAGGLKSMVKAIPGKLYDKIFDWIKDKGMKALGVTGKFFGSAASKIGDVFGFLGGGGVKPPKLYDQGGYLPPGYSTVLNKTGRPEPVLTAPQWDKIVAGQGGDTYNISVNGSNLTAEDVASAILFETKRAGRRR